MSIAPLTTASSPSLGHPQRAELSERIEAGAGATLNQIAQATEEGVSATVSFSGKALHALEHAGEAVVDGAEELALDAWHGVRAAAAGLEHVGEAVVDGVREVAAATRTAACELGHYAAIGLHAAGDAASEVASGSVLAASAVGKTVMAMV